MPKLENIPDFIPFSFEFSIRSFLQQNNNNITINRIRFLFQCFIQQKDVFL